MKPVIFKGIVPEHLLSQEAKARMAQELRAAAEDALPNVPASVALLKGALADQDTKAIVTALSVVLNDGEGAVSKTEAQRLTKRALLHLEGDCTSPITSHPTRHWRFWENPIFRLLAELPLAGMPECCDIMVELQLKVLSDGLSEKGYPHNFHDSLNEVAQALHKTDTEAAERFELRVMEAAPRFVPRRRLDKSFGDTGVLLEHNEAFLKRAWPKMSEYQREAFARQVELNWLPEDVALKFLAEGDLDRCARFTAATPQTISRALRSFMSPTAVSEGCHGPRSDSYALAIMKVPAWKPFSKDIGLLKDAFRSDWLGTQDNGERAIRRDRLAFMGHLMTSGMPASNCLALSHALWDDAIKCLESSPARYAAVSRAEILVELLYPPFVSIGHEALHKKLLQMDLLNNERLCPGGKPLLHSSDLSSFDDSIRRRLKFLEVDTAAINGFRAAFIDAGIISIDGVRPADQRKDIIGPALARNPGRLAEVDDIERFVELARRFQIPIELPADVNDAFRMQASMRAVMVAPPSAADPLAHVAPANPESRPRRRARA